MSREGLATIALRALPREVRASRGEEMVGTLLDSSAGSRARTIGGKSLGGACGRQGAA